jgi:hypothetical protein
LVAATKRKPLINNFGPNFIGRREVREENALMMYRDKIKAAVFPIDVGYELADLAFEFGRVR